MQQKINREGPNNPMFGLIKSPETIAKLQKFIYVYDSETKEFLGSYTTVGCAKYFKMGKETLTKYLRNGLPFKGKLFSRVKLF
jgi:sarcosine oxidase delta subunit